MLDKKVLPSMRSISLAVNQWDSGIGVYNCEISPIDNWKSFSE